MYILVFYIKNQMITNYMRMEIERLQYCNTELIKI